MHDVGLIIIITSSLCYKLHAQDSTFIPFFKMKDSQYQSFQYGYPDSVVGTILPIFDIKYTECKTSFNISDNCLRGYLVEKCIGHFKSDKSRMLKCNYYNDEWSNTRIQFIHSNPGLINDKSLTVINRIIDNCINSNNYLLPYLCGWEYFYKLLTSHQDGIITQLGDINLISTMYTYFYCLAANKIKSGAVLIFCPNPCQKADVACNNDANSWDGVCFLKKSGVFSNDYECQCTPGFHWSDTNNMCIRIDNCLNSNDTIYPCNRKGTNLCLHNFGVDGKEVYICLCHFGFMGSMCELKRDSCLQRLQPQIIPGNRACQVYLGNVCIPYIGTDSYECRCKSNRRNDNSQSFPNCFKIVTKCDGQVCYNNGHCTTSLDGTKALCLCGAVWSGSMCRQLKLNTWLIWEPWSYCTVTCGKGWRIRRRLCRTGNIGECSGNDRDLKPCERPCIKFSDRYKPTLKMIILVQASILAILLIYLMAYVRMRVEVVSMTQGLMNKDGQINETRAAARWFEHRSMVIRENTINLKDQRMKQFENQ